MDTSLLFENNEEREATEKILAAFKVESLNQSIDELVAYILKSAKEMDDLLEQNDLPKRFLNKVSTLSETDSISLDEDLETVDFRVREILEDLIKRINTRLTIIRDKDKDLSATLNEYDLDNLDLKEAIKIANLRKEDFV